MARVIALLQRDQGATLADLIAATDWLPHTSRAALTGLRKRGYVVACKIACNNDPLKGCFRVQ
jgi:DNA-binding IclR family transcriptional regulator